MSTSLTSRVVDFEHNTVVNAQRLSDERAPDASLEHLEHDPLAGVRGEPRRREEEVPLVERDQRGCSNPSEARLGDGTSPQR